MNVIYSRNSEFSHDIDEQPVFSAGGSCGSDTRSS